MNPGIQRQACILAFCALHKRSFFIFFLHLVCVPMTPMVQIPRPTSCKVEGGGPIFISTRQFLTPPPNATHRTIRSPKEWGGFQGNEVSVIGRRFSSPRCSVIHMEESHGSRSQSVDFRALMLSGSSGSTDKTHWSIGVRETQSVLFLACSKNKKVDRGHSRTR